MFLTREEERILAGEEGEARARALKTVIKVGEALGAERLIPIKHAHISGASYENIGDFGVEFIESFAAMGAKFAVPASVNPVSYDVEEPLSLPLKLSPEYMRAQERILKALASMGAQLELTCTPYYAGVPERHGLKAGDHVAWGESSAVAYANSVLAIRSNREGGPLALMAAIAGRTYYYGMHIDEQRIPLVEYIVEGELEEAEAGVLGEIVATRHKGERPPLITARFSSDASVREFLAAISTAGDLAMAHIREITPERPPREVERRERISREEIDEALERRAPDGPVDIIYMGCPHVSLEELSNLIKSAGSRTIISVSRSVYSRSEELARIARERGVRIVRDTCLVVSPFYKSGSFRVATNSFKAYYYLSRRGVKVYLARTRDLLGYSH